MHETSPEKPGKYPLLEAFFGNPHANAAEVAYSLMVAVNEGNLDPDKLEAALRENKAPKNQSENREGIERIKALLLEHLNGFSDSDGNNFSPLLSHFPKYPFSCI